MGTLSCWAALFPLLTFQIVFLIVKSEPFYDEFVEKQLLAGNIPCRQFSITLLSVTVMIPAVDHRKPLSNQTDVSPDQVPSLHKIQEQVS